MTGSFSSRAMVRMAWLLLGCCGLSVLVLPWTARAATPQLSISLHRESVSSMEGRSRILQETGMDKLATSRLRISLTLSGWVNKADPIPPKIEKSFGQPMLTSKPATSFSLIWNIIYSFKSMLEKITKLYYTNLATWRARLASLVPTWKTTFWVSALHVLKTTLPSSSSTKSTVPSISACIIIDKNSD